MQPLVDDSRSAAITSLQRCVVKMTEFETRQTSTNASVMQQAIAIPSHTDDTANNCVCIASQQHFFSMRGFTMTNIAAQKHSPRQGKPDLVNAI